MNQVAFLRLARKFFHGDLWMSPREFSDAEAWLDMLAFACYQPETRLCSGHAISLQPGELVGSIRFLAARWTWSKGRTERFLDALRKAGRMTFRDVNGTANRVIRLCNWELYNPPRDKLGTGTGQSPGHSWDKVEEGKELKEEKNIAGLCPAETESRGAARFKPPSIEEVRLLCAKCGLPESEAEVIWNFYESKGWMVGKTKMKSLAGCVGGWAARKRSNGQHTTASLSFEDRKKADSATAAKAARHRAIENMGKGL